MYGMVNKFFKEVITESHGLDKWNAISRSAGLDTDEFVSMQQYADDVSYRIVDAATQELDVAASDLLYSLGELWIERTSKGDYKHLYGLYGNSLVELMQNLNTLHLSVSQSMPELKPPSFKCTEVTSGSFRLHYYSDRPGLAPFVQGLISGVARLFQTDVEVRHEEAKVDGSDHDVFHVTIL